MSYPVAEELTYVCDPTPLLQSFSQFLWEVKHGEEQ
jgi:hypothetical protein